MVYIQLPKPKERLCSKKSNLLHLALSRPSRCYPLTAFHILMRTLLVFVLLAAAGFAEDDFAETKKKAEAGDAAAQNNLGYMYYKGEGVPKDDAEAAKWYRKAAEQGEANAQVGLGYMYRTGTGVPKDSAEATKLWRKAAEQGNALAQFSLGGMYYGGEGVPKDLVQAHVWWNIAGAKGDEDAKTNLGIVEKDMTSEQKAEAMKLARELFDKLPKGN